MLNARTQLDLLQYATEGASNTTQHYDIYGLKLTARDHAAVDEWRRVLSGVYEETGYDTALTLTDASLSLLPPLAYVTLMSDLWMTYLHKRLHSRNAILSAHALLPAAEEVLQALPGYGNNTVRFFLPHERADAIRWLVTDD